VFSLSLKTKEHPHGAFTEYEMYMTLAICFAYIFLDADPGKHIQLRDAAVTLSHQLRQLVQLKVAEVKDGSIVESIMEEFKPAHKYLKDYGVHMIKRLLEGGKSIDDVTSAILPTAAGGAANQGQGVSSSCRRIWNRNLNKCFD
jgi:linoleate 10R-lipoxygenase